MKLYIVTQYIEEGNAEMAYQIARSYCENEREFALRGIREVGKSDEKAVGHDT